MITVMFLKTSPEHSFCRRPTRGKAEVWTTVPARLGIGKLTVVFDYYEAMKTYSRIGLLRSRESIQSYCATTKL
jgi:hypothetical protein